MYSLADSPPEEAAGAIRSLRQNLKERREQLAQLRERMTTRAQTTAAAVNLGKIVEKIVPSFSSFAHAAGDCRALFEPIDYIVFSGLAKTGMWISCCS
jgi:predicted Holliday junction resolvase-like endonuclease